METQPGHQPRGGTDDHQAHEQRLAAALRDLLREADLGAYRDSGGQPLSSNRAFQRAQAVVEEFGLTHEQVCGALSECGSDEALAAAARKLVESRQASPDDVPIEYQTWHTGP